MCALATDDEDGKDRGCGSVACGGSIVCAGGFMRTTPIGKVVPFWAQLSAHSNSASELVLFFCSSAALQQSMSIIPPMLQLLSPKWSGTPANAPPKSTSRRNKDASRFFTTNVTLLKTINKSQRFRSQRDQCPALSRQGLCPAKSCQYPPDNWSFWVNLRFGAHNSSSN